MFERRFKARRKTENLRFKHSIRTIFEALISRLWTEANYQLERYYGTYGYSRILSIGFSGWLPFSPPERIFYSSYL